MFRLGTILSLSVFLLATPQVDAKEYPPSFQKECIQDLKDPYDRGWAFPAQTRSPYRGQCIDTSLKRPALFLKANDREIHFANFYYKGRYYTATIPAGAVKKVYFQIAEFKKIMGVIQPAHTQLRFFLHSDRPMTLISQSGRLQRVQLTDFVFSSDYMAPTEVPYDALRGMREIFMNVSRFVSTPDRVQLQTVVNGNTVRQFHLEIPFQQLDQTLLAAVSLSANRGTMDVYNTFSMNCTTEAFRVLYAGLGGPIPDRTWRPGNPLNPVTNSSLARLRNMGLIHDNSEVQTLNEEFPQN